LSAPLISIIDDDRSMLLALAGLLRSLGFAVEAYSAAETFLQSRTRDTSDCIITDIQMAGLSGIELKQWLDAHANVTPVIMITARPEAHLHAQALACGAVCLLKKPFDSAALLASLRRARIT
jgi:FixJ family two-component response regulator